MIKLDDSEHLEEQLYDITKNDPLLCKKLYHNGTFPDVSKEEFLKKGRKFRAKKYGATFYILLDDSTVIGSISLHSKSNELCSIGYFIGSDYWGMGYGKTAFKLILPEVRRKGFRRATASIKSDNIASIKIWDRYNPKKAIDEDIVVVEIDISSVYGG